MTDMIERAAVAIGKAEGYDTKRVAVQSYTKHARAALLAALDLTPDEHLEIAREMSATEVRTGGIAYYRDTLDTVLAALKKRTQGE